MAEDKDKDKDKEKVIPTYVVDKYVTIFQPISHISYPILSYPICTLSCICFSSYFFGCYKLFPAVTSWGLEETDIVKKKNTTRAKNIHFFVKEIFSFIFHSASDFNDNLATI